MASTSKAVQRAAQQAQQAMAKAQALQAQAQAMEQLNPTQVAGIKANQYAVAFANHIVAAAKDGNGNEKLSQLLPQLQHILATYNNLIAMPTALQKQIPTPK